MVDVAGKVDFRRLVTAAAAVDNNIRMMGRRRVASPAVDPVKANPPPAAPVAVLAEFGCTDRTLRVTS